jgi:hypothetical protein
MHRPLAPRRVQPHAGPLRNPIGHSRSILSLLLVPCEARGLGVDCLNRPIILWTNVFKVFWI